MSQRALESQSQYKQKYFEFGAFNPIILYINFQSPEKNNSIDQCTSLTEIHFLEDFEVDT